MINLPTYPKIWCHLYMSPLKTANSRTWQVHLNYWHLIRGNLLHIPSMLTLKKRGRLKLYLAACSYLRFILDLWILAAFRRSKINKHLFIRKKITFSKVFFWTWHCNFTIIRLRKLLTKFYNKIPTCKQPFVHFLQHKSKPRFSL